MNRHVLIIVLAIACISISARAQASRPSPGSDREALQLYRLCLDSPYVADRQRAVEALAAMKPGPDVAAALAHALRDDAPIITFKAIRGLARMGEAGVGPLVEALELPEGPRHSDILRAIDETGAADESLLEPMEAVLQTSYQPVQLQRECYVLAMRILGRLGDKAAPAVPTILAASWGINEEDLKDAAGATLARIGPKGSGVAIPLLLDAAEETFCFRPGCVRALCAWQFAPQITPRLTEMASSSQAQVKLQALMTFAQTGSSFDGGAEAFIKGLKDGELFDVMAESNGQPSFAEAAGAFVAVAKHYLSPSVPTERRRLAAHWFSRLADLGPEAAEVLVQALKDPDSRVRREAASTLNWAKPVPATYVLALGTALRDRDSGVSEYAALTLGRLDAAAAPALPALVESLKNENHRDSAIEAIANIGLYDPQAARALAGVAQGAAEPSEPLSRALGRQGSGALDEARSLLKSNNRAARQIGADALRLMGPGAAATAGDLRALLSDAAQPPEIRLAAAAALADMGRPAAVASLDAALACFDLPLPQRYVQGQLLTRDAYALLAGSAGPAAVDELLKRLGSKTLVVRWRAIAALGATGASGKAVPAALGAVLNDENRTVVAAATAALLELRSPEALEVLRARLSKPGVEGGDALKALESLTRTGEQAQLPLQELVLMLDGAKPAANAARRRLKQRGPCTAKDLNGLCVILQHGKGNALRYAIDAVKALGPAAAKPQTFTALASVLHRDNPQDYREGTYDEIRSAAARILVAYGAAGVAAIESTYDQLKDHPRMMLVESLGGVGRQGEPLVPLLRRALSADRGDSNTRTRAVISLGKLGPAGRTAMVQLQAIFLSGDSDWRSEVLARSMLQIGPIDKDLVAMILNRSGPDYHGDDLSAVVASMGSAALNATLAVAADAKNDNTYLQAIKTLGRIRPFSPRALDAILAARESAIYYMPDTIVDALATSGTREPKAAVAIAATAGSDEHIDEKVAQAMAAMGAAAKPGIDQLAAAYRSGKLHPTHFFVILGKSGPAAVPELLKHLDKPDCTEAVLWALKYSGPQAAEAIPALQKMLTEPKRSDDVRQLAKEALKSIGGAPDELVAELVQQFQSDFPMGRDSEERIERVVTMGEAVIPALEKLLKDPNGRKRQVAANILGAMGEAAAKAVPALQAATRDRWPDVAAAARAALRQVQPPRRRAELVANLGPMPPRMVYLLEQCLRQGSGEAQFYAAHALAGMGPSAAVAAESLLALARDSKDPGTREGAIGALGNIRPASEDIRKALQRALADRNEAVRRAAADAIRKNNAAP
ncbi:MAG: HEAT repeat domain-containing protein [Planctomycetaceae bacterium]|nr:HEAT repeat domain-containing protein [Planctomycetaceae bacterium]